MHNNPSAKNQFEIIRPRTLLQWNVWNSVPDCLCLWNYGMSCWSLWILRCRSVEKYPSSEYPHDRSRVQVVKPQSRVWLLGAYEVIYRLSHVLYIMCASIKSLRWNCTTLQHYSTKMVLGNLILLLNSDLAFFFQMQTTKSANHFEIRPGTLLQWNVWNLSPDCLRSWNYGKSRWFSWMKPLSLSERRKSETNTHAWIVSVYVRMLLPGNMF